MIDSHVHLRDWDWKHKETLEHGLMVAERVGLDGVYDMPNTLPAITIEELVVRRLNDAKKAQEKLERKVFYGLYVGVTPDTEQVKRAVEIHRKYFPKPGDLTGVIGLKMFAGYSVSDLGVVKEDEQLGVYETLFREGFEGVLADHCEKESCMHPELWNSENSISHCYARSSTAEIESAIDQIMFATHTGYAVKGKSKGKLHLLHLSLPVVIDLVCANRYVLNLTCETTPNYLLLNSNVMRMPDGIMYKVNPPLRALHEQLGVLERFKLGFVDVLASDHAPHTFEEKTSGKFMSGMPGLPCWARYMASLDALGVPAEILGKQLDNSAVNRIFGTSIPATGRLAKWEDVQELVKDYAFNPVKYIG